MKAMELVAASKMRKATQLALATRAYSSELAQLTRATRALLGTPTHRLLVGRGNDGRAVPKTLCVVVASDRGLCGGFNNQVVKKAIEFIKSRTGNDVALVTVGRRAEQVVRRTQLPLLASFESISNAPSFDRSRALGTFVTDQFLTGGYDRIFLLYTKFESALRQIPTILQLLPLIPEEELRTGTDAEEDETEAGDDGLSATFEPSPKDVLERLLPRTVEMAVYQTLLESSASEHSARMMAMRSAGDSAKDMLEGLTLTLNQARQASITREISEISAGKAAIE